MPTREYVRKYIAAEAHIDGRRSYLAFFSTLTQPDWEDALRDVVFEDPALLEMIPEPKDGDVLPVVTSLLMELAPDTRTCAGQALSRLISGLRTTQSNTCDKALARAILLASATPTSHVTTALASLLADDATPEHLQAHAAGTLASADFAVPLSFWERLDLEAHPFLLTAFLTAMSRIDPENALRTATTVPALPSPSAPLEYSLRLCIRHLVQRRGDHSAVLNDLLKAAPLWLRNALRGCVELDEFQRLGLNELFVPRPDWRHRLGKEEFTAAFHTAQDECRLGVRWGRYLASALQIAERQDKTQLIDDCRVSFQGDRFQPAWQRDLIAFMLRGMNKFADTHSLPRISISDREQQPDNFQTMTRDFEEEHQPYLLLEPWFNDPVRARRLDVVPFGTISVLILVAADPNIFTIAFAGEAADWYSLSDSDYFQRAIPYNAWIRGVRAARIAICAPSCHATDNTLLRARDCGHLEYGQHVRKETISEVAAFLLAHPAHSVAACDVGVAFELQAHIETEHEGHKSWMIPVAYPRPIPVGFVYRAHPKWTWWGDWVAENLRQVVSNPGAAASRSLQVTAQLSRLLGIKSDWQRLQAFEGAAHVHQ